MVTNLSLPHSYCASLEIELKKFIHIEYAGAGSTNARPHSYCASSGFEFNNSFTPTAQGAGIFFKKVLDSKSESF